jgi:1-acyl-sn-glycerol-3-phosphate acyltransferase
MKNKKKKKKWIKFRHKVVRNLAWLVIYPYAKLKYGMKIHKFKDENKRAYFILYNHQTAFDQFFVGMAFKQPIYYIASEDLFSNGFTSSLIKYLVAPIPIKKSMTDVRAVIDSKKVAKEGGSIAVAPEGNRTFSGETGYIKPAIAQMVKALNLPLVIYNLDGGYGVHPRWSDVVRKGKMDCYVSKVIEPDEYNSLSNDELYELICKELYHNECTVDNLYPHKKSCEYLERAMYYCPDCGFSEWESKGQKISCKKCGKQVKYLATKELEGVNCDFPYRFISEWYNAQCDYVINSDLSSYADIPVYSDVVTNYNQVVPYKKKIKIAKNINFSVYSDRYTIKNNTFDVTIPFDSITAVSVLGRNKLNIYIGSEIYQIKTKNKRFNALKYMNIYYHSVNVSKGVLEHGKLLGI